MVDLNVILGGVSILQTLALFYVGAKAAKIDKLQDQLERKAAEIIDARMQVLEARFAASLGRIEQVAANMERRLADGDEHFDVVDEKNRRLELKTQEMVGSLDKSLSVRMADMATRKDLEALSQRFSAFEVAIAKHLTVRN